MYDLRKMYFGTFPNIDCSGYKRTENGIVGKTIIAVGYIRDEGRLITILLFSDSTYFPCETWAVAE